MSDVMKNELFLLFFVASEKWHLKQFLFILPRRGLLQKHNDLELIFLK
jgi:hypothetical protein